MTQAAEQIQPLPLDELAHSLLVAKQREDEAKQHRIAIENALYVPKDVAA